MKKTGRGPVSGPGLPLEKIAAARLPARPDHLDYRNNKSC